MDSALKLRTMSTPIPAPEPGISLYSHQCNVIAGMTRNLIMFSEMTFHGEPDPCHAGPGSAILPAIKGTKIRVS